MDITFTEIIPVLRIFDIAKADEFYLGFLGFKVDWDHRFEPELPLYRQISRDALVLHPSEHHGDACPGAQVRVMMTGIQNLHGALTAKRYGMRPGLERMPWGTLEIGVTDPFGSQRLLPETVRWPGL